MPEGSINDPSATRKCPRAHKRPVDHAKHGPGRLWARGHLRVADGSFMDPSGIYG